MKNQIVNTQAIEHKAAEPFLRLVAKTFLQQHPDDMHRICFVFPNRRSGVFFAKELEDLVATPILAPCVTTITDFLNDITGAVEVSRVESLLILYQKYKELMGENSPDFDKFSYWGDIILNDFNDVDKYLANTDIIFKNIRDLKAIKSDFLTEEQKAVIIRYFGENWLSHHENNQQRMWRDERVYNSNSNNTDRFVEIWDILADLYKNFNEELDNRGLSYSGKIYRKAVDDIHKMNKEDFTYNEYVFVGFNVLSLSEIKIFDYLNKKGIADFYWDCESPYFGDDDNSHSTIFDIKQHNKASYFINKNKKLFKSKLDLNQPKIDYFNPITVLGIPSNVGQAKYAATTIIQSLIKDGAITDIDNAINTAIVLPDENLFIPLLDSISEEITNVNITMGYPLRFSAIATLMTQIAKMHKQARKSSEGITYFNEDVIDILSHPFIKSIAMDEACTITDDLHRSNIFYIPATYITEKVEKLKAIFTPISPSRSTAELVKYVRRILSFIDENLVQNDTEMSRSVEAGFIEQYAELLNQLSYTLTKYDIEMNDNTFFYLIGRLLNSATVAFEGEPLKGLQVMGVLETRSLDFENVIILSMNERIFPRKHYSRSFIPHNLRRAFGMATVEFQECMYAYYFFRLISRAKNTYLLYDARTQSLSSGEASRYVEQIRMLYPKAKLSQRVIGFYPKSPSEIQISIKKNERIMKSLNRYRTWGSEKYLSASSINQYINCPLSFYFEKVEELRIDDEATEFMNAGMLGTIVHSVMNKIYDHISVQKTKIVSPQKIESILKDKNYIHNIVISTINEESLGKKNCTDILSGEILLVKDAIIFFTKAVLNYDKDLGGFKFIMAEKEQKVKYNISENFDINLRLFIDRVDEITDEESNPILRIVDYKTGKDSTRATDMNALFNPAATDRKKAMLQLLLYCNAYAIDKNCTDPIRPVIYTVRTMSTSGFTFNRHEVTDYRDINDQFKERFNEVITEMFDKNVNFTQAANDKYCKYCKFVDICHR